MPLATKPLYAWFVAIIALFSIQMSYNIVSGLVATVTLNAAGPGGFIQSGQDIAFALFLSIFSPMLSVALGAGGGMALFREGQRAFRSAITASSAVAGPAVIRIAQLTSHIFSRRAHTQTLHPSPSAAHTPSPANNLRALPQSKA